MLTTLKDIVPDKEEERAVMNTAKHFISKLSSKFKEGKIVLGGSIAKGTWLKGGYDIDIFAVFDKKYSEKDISAILEKRLNSLKPVKISGVRKVHGSRDYFQIKEDPYVFEVIPIINIKKSTEARNITDISPLHTKWVGNNSDKQLRDDIRLAKAFCKANNIYGAESYIKGFSGYTLEVLTIYYGSFLRLINNAIKWKKGQVIDIAKHYNGLNESKRGPLIVIDPVQYNRNVAAALSEKKFEIFIELAKKFIRNPDKCFFERKKIELEDLKDAIVLTVVPLKGKEDIVGSKLIKALEFIEKRLDEEGFEVESSDWDWNGKALFWFYVKNKKLPKKYKHYGPPIKEEAHLNIFREKYKNKKLKREGARVYVDLDRKCTDVHDFMKELIKHPYIKEKVKEIKILKK